MLYYLNKTLRLWNTTREIAAAWAFGMICFLFILKILNGGHLSFQRKTTSSNVTLKFNTLMPYSDVLFSSSLHNPISVKNNPLIKVVNPLFEIKPYFFRNVYVMFTNVGFFSFASWFIQDDSYICTSIKLPEGDSYIGK